MRDQNSIPGVIYGATLYFCSDSAGLGYRVRLAASRPLAEIGQGDDFAAVLGQFVDGETLSRLRADADDWRPMTPAEIAEYEADHA